MKIRTMDDMHYSIGESLAGFNFAPKLGDSGHVDDHATVAKALFDAPNIRLRVGVATKEDGAWTLASSGRPGAETIPSDFDAVSEFMEQVGVVVVDPSGGALADGVTDWDDDADIPDGTTLFAFANGLVGLSLAVSNVMMDVNDLAERIGDLEAAQA